MKDDEDEDDTNLQNVKDEDEEEYEEADQEIGDGMKLCEESGLTEQERRAIRADQRRLLQDLEENDGTELEQARVTNNKLFKKVRHTREAVLDGEALKAITSKASKQVEKLIQAPRYDANRLVTKLVQKCRVTGGGSSFFDWASLGEETSVCFNSIPFNVSFLNGPLTDGAELQLRQRAQRKPRARDEAGEEKKPEEVKEQVRNADQLSAIEKSMKDMHKILKKGSRASHHDKKRHLIEKFGDEVPSVVAKRLKKQGPDIDAIQFLFNPTSFTQTVENIFAYSFLVKNGKAGIAVREPVQAQDDGIKWEKGVTCRVVNDSAPTHTVAKQSIVALTMKDWRDLCEAYNVTKGDLPNRSGSQVRATQSTGPGTSARSHASSRS